MRTAELQKATAREKVNQEITAHGAVETDHELATCKQAAFRKRGMSTT